MVETKYPWLSDKYFPPSEQELARREAIARRDAGLPPKQPRPVAERFAQLLIDYPDIFAPVVRALMEENQDGRQRTLAAA